MKFILWMKLKRLHGNVMHVDNGMIFFGVKVAPPGQNEPKPSPHLINWSAGEDL